jgi:hypothetical protein
MPSKLKCTKCSCICYSTNKANPVCRACIPKRSKEDIQKYRKFHATKKKYNIDETDYVCLWIAFKGKCGICEKNLKENTSTRGQSLDTATIDHDHKTGNMRGLLCAACNKALGLVNENPVILEKMKEYVNGT